MLFLSLLAQNSVAQYYYAGEKRVPLAIDEYRILVKTISTKADTPVDIQELFPEFIRSVESDPSVLHNLLICLLKTDVEVTTAIEQIKKSDYVQRVEPTYLVDDSIPLSLVLR